MPGVSQETLQMLMASWPILVTGLIFYLLFYRPQKKQQQQRSDLLNKLKKGDRVITTGGMYGTITSLDTKKVTLKVAEKLEIDFLRTSIQGFQIEQKNS